MLIQLEDFKQHIDLNTNDDDAVLETYIQAAGEFLEKKIGRVIELVEDFTEYFDGDDISDRIFLTYYPVAALGSLQYRAGTYSAPDWTAFDADDYQVDTDSGIIYLDTVYSGRRNIKVVYDAGYAAANIPAPLKVAAMKLVAKIYNKRRSDGFSSEEVAGASIEWDKFMSSDIEELIAPYRKIII